MKQFIKLFLFSVLVVLYFITAAPFYLIARFFPYRARIYTTRICQLYAKAALKVLGIKYSQDGESSIGNRLIVANHLSYIDILLMAASRPTCFVTSVEIRRTPFLGQICELGGCLYVERRSRDNLNEEISDITNALMSGLNVTVFPEATSTNGEELKRFKSPLFRAAINSGRSVVPVSINYKKINNSKVNMTNRDSIFWYDDMRFGPHIWNLMKFKHIDTELVFGDEVLSSCEKKLSLISHRAVKKNLDIYL